MLPVSPTVCNYYCWSIKILLLFFYSEIRFWLIQLEASFGNKFNAIVTIELLEGVNEFTIFETFGFIFSRSCGVKDVGVGMLVLIIEVYNEDKLNTG